MLFLLLLSSLTNLHATLKPEVLIDNYWRDIDCNTGFEGQRYFNAEHRLYDDLLRYYSNQVRPVRNTSAVLQVNVSFSLSQLAGLDDANEVLTMSGWLGHMWRDEYLTWNPDEYCGLTVARLPSSRIWTPDLVLHNDADDYQNDFLQVKVVVTNDGVVRWWPPGKLRATCDVRPYYFPFDDQICWLTFGSWMYDGTQLDLNAMEGSMLEQLEFIPRGGEYEITGQWTIRQTLAKKCVRMYNKQRTSMSLGDSNDTISQPLLVPVPTVRFFIHMQRKLLYYGFQIILPCVIISAITPFIFILPCDNNISHKITFGTTLIVSYMFFMMQISDVMPETEEKDGIPILSIYVMMNLYLAVISVVVTAFIMQLHYPTVSNVEPPPPSLEWFVVDVLGPLLLYKAHDNNSRRKSHVDLSGAATDFGGNDFVQQQGGRRSTLVTSNTNDVDQLPYMVGHGISSTNTAHHELPRSTWSISEIAPTASNTGLEKWQLIAQILNRFLFVLFYVALICFSAYLLVVKPGVYVPINYSVDGVDEDEATMLRENRIKLCS